MQLITDNVPGNLHQASSTITEWGLAQYVLAMEHSGGYTITVFRVPDAIAPRIREWMRVLPEFRDNKPLVKDMQWLQKEGHYDHG